MAQKPEVVLSEQDASKVVEANDIIAGAIQEHCNCSAAKIAPERIGLSYGRGRIEKLETVTGLAGRFAICNGFSGGLCHFPDPITTQE